MAVGFIKEMGVGVASACDREASRVDTRSWFTLIQSLSAELSAALPLECVTTTTQQDFARPTMQVFEVGLVSCSITGGREQHQHAAWSGRKEP